MANIDARLQDWVSGEFQLESDVAYQSLCRGFMSDVWLYVINNVKPLPVVLYIRNNINWNELQTNCTDVKRECDEMNKDICRRDTHLSEVRSRNAELNISVHQLNRLHAGIDRNENDHYFIETNATNLKSKISYYLSAKQQMEHYISLILKESITSKANQYYTRENLNGMNVLASACMKSTSDQLKEFCKLLLQLENKLNNSCNNIRSFGLDHICERFLDVSKTYTLKDIMDCLSSLIDERIEGLKATLNSITLETDMGSLQYFNHPIVGLADKSKTPTEVGTTTLLMMTGKLSVVEKFKESKMKSQIRLNISQENAKLFSQIWRKTEQTHIKEFTESECDLNSCNGELRSLIEMCDVLENELGKNIIYQNCIKSALLEIKNFNDSKARKELIIQKLVSMNFAGHKKLSNKLKVIALLKRKTIGNSMSSLKRIIAPFFQPNEVGMFVAVSENPIKVAKLNHKLVLLSSLSINHPFLKIVTRDEIERSSIADKRNEDMMIDFLEMYLRKPVKDIINIQQKQTEENISVVDMKSFQMKIQSNYRQKVIMIQKALVKEAKNQNDWLAVYKSLKNLIELWENRHAQGHDSSFREETPHVHRD